MRTREGAKTAVDITVNTSSQMKNLGQEEATTDNIVNRKLILGKEYRTGQSNLVDFGTTKIIANSNQVRHALVAIERSIE